MTAHLKWNALVGVVVLGLAAIYFMQTRHVVSNRYTDATWHIAVADEYAKTGLFAKDPFFPGAPRFAQFGLIDFVNGAVVRFAGISTETVFWVTNMLWVLLFFVLAMATGYLWTHHMTGIYTGLVFFVLPELSGGFHRLGWAFTIALILGWFSVALAIHWQGKDRGHYSEGGGRRLVHLAALGGLCGLIFNLHPFVGLWLLMVHGMTMLIDLLLMHVRTACQSRSRRSPTHQKTGIGSCGRKAMISSFAGLLLWGMCALVVAAPWIWLHLSLRSALDLNNAHQSTTDTVSLTPIMLVACFSAIVLVISALLTHRKPDSMKSSAIMIGLSLGLALILAIPPINHWVTVHTSAYMASRVFSFVPVGLILVGLFDVGLRALSAFGVMKANAGRSSGRSSPIRAVSSLEGRPPCRPVCVFERILIYVVMVAVLVVLLPVVLLQAKVHAYFLQTDEYDIHPYADLRQLEPFDLTGLIVLSDPYTSYFARRFLGCYAVTVPPGHASPAVDYASRDQVWELAWADPESALSGSYGFDYVLFNKVSRPIGSLDVGLIKQAVAKWKPYTDIIHDSDDYVLMKVQRKSGNRKVESGKYNSGITTSDFPIYQ